MRINLTTASPDTLFRETLILGFFADERPPKGFCGLVDWRLNGAVSSQIASRRLSGSYLEKAACLIPGRIPAARILLVGLGELGSLTYDRLYNAGYEMARTASGIAATDLALPIPGAGRGRLQLSGMTEALITGLLDAWVHEPPPQPVTDLEIPARAEEGDEIRLGLDRARRHVAGAEVEIAPTGILPTAEAVCPLS